ncbi:MAG TPA: helicase-related protein, partial [Kofleriaceae bacterium]|nr:helicase-related protein [Kofleriaceae bacterium]
ARPALDLHIESSAAGDALGAQLLARITAARQTIVFVNSRRMAEKLAHDINELAGDTVIRAHHGSLSRPARRWVEARFASGALRAICATSSLELGIDIAAVDLVIQLESPRSVTRGLQRIGRAGHRAGAESRGVIIPRKDTDLGECVAVAAGMLSGDIEPIAAVKNPLDVLAQHIVAMVAQEPWTVADLAAVARRAHSFRALSDAALGEVLAMLSGELRLEQKPRVAWDRARDVVSGRRGAKLLAVTNAGTIPDRGLFPVVSAETGARVGQLDEEMVYELRGGETFTLGASTWRVAELSHDRVIAMPAPGEAGKLPFWRGDSPGRPLAVGARLGALYSEIAALSAAEARCHVTATAPISEAAADRLVALIHEQRDHDGAVPSDRAIVVERFRDAIGEIRTCVLSPYGSRVHTPWSLAIAASFRARGEPIPPMTTTDDGIALVADVPVNALAFDPATVRAQVMGELAGSALFAGHFRECAARALLLPRRRPGKRTPLWQARLRAQRLLANAATIPGFPMVTETLRECMDDVFDMPALESLLARIAGGDLAIDQVTRHAPSPMARHLAFSVQAAFLYEGDAPLAERRAQALAADHALIHRLSGGVSQISGLIDDDTIAAFFSERQRLVAGWQARDADEVHDLLRELGDLDSDEIAARTDGDAAAVLGELAAARRAMTVTVGNRERWIAAADEDLYRRFAGGDADAVAESVLRWASARGPVTAEEISARFAIAGDVLDGVIATLTAGGDLTAVDDGRVCATSSLFVLRRRALEKLRAAIEPVDTATVARFALARHGLWPDNQEAPAPVAGDQALDEALAHLEGARLPVTDLFLRILPARVPGFDLARLDARAAAGDLVWLGCGALGDTDARALLCRREHLGAFFQPPDEDALFARVPLAAAILDLLRDRGALFFTDLAAAVGAPTNDVRAAVRELALGGAITGDSVAALVALATHKPVRRHRRARVRLERTIIPGRFALAGAATTDPISATRILTEATLARHGVVCREVIDSDGLAGGFSRIAPMLRAMEQVGTVRRGRFLQAVAGAQFAAPGLVDGLRRERDAGQAGPKVFVLAATDPANLYGVLAPWPEAVGAIPIRRAGATVILVDGRPVWFVHRGQRRLSTFAAASDGDRALAARYLYLAAQRLRRRTLRIDVIGDGPARPSPLAPLLLAAGFRGERTSLTFERG